LRQKRKRGPVSLQNRETAAAPDLPDLAGIARFLISPNNGHETARQVT